MDATKINDLQLLKDRNMVKIGERIHCFMSVFVQKKKTIVAVMQRGIIALKRAKTYSIAVRWLCWNDILRNSDFALIASYIIKGNHEKLITLFSTYIEKVCISSITAGELYFGAMKKKMPV